MTGSNPRDSAWFSSDANTSTGNGRSENGKWELETGNSKIETGLWGESGEAKQTQ
jgi:hypothetical protein